MELTQSWELTRTPAGAIATPDDLRDLDWSAAQVPGTAASAFQVEGIDFDDFDWWYRTRFPRPPATSGEVRHVLELDGLATVSEVFLNGELVVESSSMWKRQRIDVTGTMSDENELAIAFRALGPLLGQNRRPRQRWRTRLVHDGGVRWFRTMIFGRSPGYAPSPAPVGPWRSVRLTPMAPAGIDKVSVRTRIDGTDGVVIVRALPRGDVRFAEVVHQAGRSTLQLGADGWLQSELRITAPGRWWPHTHGNPVLHDVSIECDGNLIAQRRIGFRSLSFAENICEQGLDLRVNDIPIFVRGAVWTPADLVSLAPSVGDLRRVLELARDAGMNMLRIVGTGAYESSAFHDLCDELGLLVWQDLMFASLDYPIADPAFRAVVTQEVEQVLEDLTGRPSFAVLCGSHELEQQPALLGLDPTLGRDEFWEDVVAGMVSDARADCAYVRSTPCGGVMPFEPRRGIAHYFGIGGFFGELGDVRRAEVRFAAECLPFANVPDETDLPVHHPLWKSGVQRDAGPAFQLAPGFDFDDVRDFYLARLFDVDPVWLRRFDQERYFELSRAVSGEMMAEVMGEWRREASPCRGALILWLKDMVPGAGFGVLHHDGAPKTAYSHLRRALAPIGIWTTDEGLAGVEIHVANDRADVLHAELRLALYQNLESRVSEATEIVELPPRGGCLVRTVEGMLGRFVDSALAYGFGPPAHDAIVVSLTSTDAERRLIAQAFRFPAGRPLHRETVESIGLTATASRLSDGDGLLTISTRRLAYGVRIHVPGFLPDDDAFSVEPGAERIIRLRVADDTADLVGGQVSAINLLGRETIAVLPRPSGAT